MKLCIKCGDRRAALTGHPAFEAGVCVSCWFKEPEMAPVLKVLLKDKKKKR